MSCWYEGQGSSITSSRDEHLQMAIISCHLVPDSTISRLLLLILHGNECTCKTEQRGRMCVEL
jgi:hypothetical protein